MRVISYNTRGSLGMDGIRNTRRIADVVRGLSPDIVCFQEIHRKLAWSGNEDQPAVLGALLNRPFAFQANVRFGLGGYGVGIAYRGRLLERKVHLLPSLKEQRGVLELRLRDVGGIREITVFCTHFGLDSGERLRQAEFLVEKVREVVGPVVVCGDFNEGSGAEGISVLVGKAGLVDADSVGNAPTFPSANPNVRIDYVLFAGGLMAYNVEVIRSLASDHLPLLVDFCGV